MPRPAPPKPACNPFRGASQVPAVTDLLVILNFLLLFAGRLMRVRK